MKDCSNLKINAAIDRNNVSGRRRKLFMRIHGSRPRKNHLYVHNSINLLTACSLILWKYTSIKSEKNKMKEYDLVEMTPIIAPGIDASPFMTWGSIEGTPINLDAQGHGNDTEKFVDEFHRHHFAVIWKRAFRRTNFSNERNLRSRTNCWYNRIKKGDLKFTAISH